MTRWWHYAPEADHDLEVQACQELADSINTLSPILCASVEVSPAGIWVTGTRNDGHTVTIVRPDYEVDGEDMDYYYLDIMTDDGRFLEPELCADAKDTVKKFVAYMMETR